MADFNLPELELELIDLLRGQGLPIEEIRLIGLLGKGTRATAFSVIIDGVYHVLKVYDSKDSLRAELKNLKKIIPKDRFLFSWQEQMEGSKLNLAIIEVPEGRELNSGLLTPTTIDRLAERLAELHSIRYRQRVSVTNLREQLKRYTTPFLDHIKLMGRDVAPYQQVVQQLNDMLTGQPELFRINKVRIHGDLWWPNIIVANEDVYLIDWESVRRSDAAEDLAKLRVFIYGYRTPAVPTFFWQAPEQRQQMADLITEIVATHTAVTGDQDLTERLRFYLPYFCIYELAQRYLHNASMKSMNHVVADDLLNLIKDPLAAPPDLTKHSYFDEVEALRYRED